MKPHLLRRILCPIPLLAVLMTGCTEENVSERLYTQTLGISGSQRIILHAQAFDKTEALSGTGSSPADALSNAEAAQGSRIFIGHTELLCLDGTRTLEETHTLFSEHGLSPACKVICTDLSDAFSENQGERMLNTVRMSEKNGLLAVTDLSTVLNEWLGQRKTALLPAVTGDTEGMVFLHADGTRTILSEDAVRGMYWLRPHDDGEISITLGTSAITCLDSSLKKSVETGNDNVTLVYALTIRSEDCPSDQQKTAAALILQQCNAAAEEMLAARADVIGMEELLASAGLEEFPEHISIRTEVLVK